MTFSDSDIWRYANTSAGGPRDDIVIGASLGPGRAARAAMIGLPSPKHKLPEGVDIQEVYCGVPILCYRDETMRRNEYGVALCWYGRIIDQGKARLGREFLVLLHETRDAIEMLITFERAGMLNPDGTLK